MKTNVWQEKCRFGLKLSFNNKYTFTYVPCYFSNMYILKKLKWCSIEHIMGGLLLKMMYVPLIRVIIQLGRLEFQFYHKIETKRFIRLRFLNFDKMGEYIHILWKQNKIRKLELLKKILFWQWINLYWKEIDVWFYIHYLFFKWVLKRRFWAKLNVHM